MGSLSLFLFQSKKRSGLGAEPAARALSPQPTARCPFRDAAAVRDRRMSSPTPAAAEAEGAAPASAAPTRPSPPRRPPHTSSSPALTAAEAAAAPRPRSPPPRRRRRRCVQTGRRRSPRPRRKVFSRPVSLDSRNSWWNEWPIQFEMLGISCCCLWFR